MTTNAGGQNVTAMTTNGSRRSCELRACSLYISCITIPSSDACPAMLTSLPFPSSRLVSVELPAKWKTQCRSLWLNMNISMAEVLIQEPPELHQSTPGRFNLWWASSLYGLVSVCLTLIYLNELYSFSWCLPPLLLSHRATLNWGRGFLSSASFPV